MESCCSKVRKLKRNKQPLFRMSRRVLLIFFCARMLVSLRARIIHDGSSQNRVVAKRDRHAMPIEVT